MSFKKCLKYLSNNPISRTSENTILHKQNQKKGFHFGIETDLRKQETPNSKCNKKYQKDLETNNLNTKYTVEQQKSVRFELIGSKKVSGERIKMRLDAIKGK